MEKDTSQQKMIKSIKLKPYKVMILSRLMVNHISISMDKFIKLKSKMVIPMQ